MITVCGQEFEFSSLDANDLARSDQAGQRMQQAFAREQKRSLNQPGGSVDGIRASCRIFARYIDDVLGQGAAQRLGLNDHDLAKALLAVDEMVEAILRDQKQLDPLLHKYQGRGAKVAQPPVSYPATPAAQLVRRVDKNARRQQLLAELAALENG